MKFKKYRVYFNGGGVIEIWALCVDDAKILAQAQAIKDAMPKQVLTIVQINED